MEEGADVIHRKADPVWKSWVIHQPVTGNLDGLGSCSIACQIHVVWLHVTNIRECGSTLYVGMAQGVSLSLYIGIGAKFGNTQKTAERRLRTAEYRTVLL